MKKETLEEAQKQQFNYDNLHDAKEISSRIKVVETLEEVAEKYAELSYYNRDEVDAFVSGAKWQMERSYSEEDFKLFARQYYREIKMDKSNLLWDELAINV